MGKNAGYFLYIFRFHIMNADSLSKTLNVSNKIL